MTRLVRQISWAAGLALVILAVGCLLRLVAVQRSSITRLRQEIDSLRLELQAAQQAQQAHANIAAPPAATLPEEQLRELLRLRGKAGLFRSQADELAQLQQENRRLRGALASTESTAGGTTNAFAARSPVSLAELGFAGYATPEAALESLLWSERETNLTAYMTSLLPDRQSEEQTRLQRQSEQGDGGLFFQEPGGVTGFQFLDSRPVSEDEVALTFFVKGRELVMKTVVKRIGTEWKFYAGLTF
jgi:hypothetical protein